MCGLLLPNPFPYQIQMKITILSRAYPIKCNSSLFLHRNIILKKPKKTYDSESMLLDHFSSKLLHFITIFFFSYQNKSLQEHYYRLNLTFNRILQIILEHITFFPFRLQLQYLHYVPHVYIQNLKTEHFQHTQAKQFEWRVPHLILV